METFCYLYGKLESDHYYISAFVVELDGCPRLPCNLTAELVCEILILNSTKSQTGMKDRKTNGRYWEEQTKTTRKKKGNKEKHDK